jgi:hypothetical protein
MHPIVVRGGVVGLVVRVGRGVVQLAGRGVLAVGVGVQDGGGLTVLFATKKRGLSAALSDQGLSSSLGVGPVTGPGPDPPTLRHPEATR